MSPEEIERLRQFFGAYFHQDWHLDAPDADGIIDTFVSDHPNPQELTTLATLVETYAESQPDDSQLESALFSELWCDFVPTATGRSAHDWLRYVANRLRAAAKE